MQERLREVLGADAESQLDEELDEDFDGQDTLPAGRGRGDTDGGIATVAAVRRLQGELAGLTWSVPKSERLQAASSLLLKGSSILAHLKLLSDSHVEAGRQDLAAASALALRRARVVGATVVGAARRLEALRAAEPFAMVTAPPSRMALPLQFGSKELPMPPSL